MRYYITTRQNTPLIHHIICTENIGMDPVVPCLFDDFFAAFLTKSGKITVPTLFPNNRGETMKVNSMHHQAVGRLAKQAEAAARTEDGIIEAIS